MKLEPVKKSNIDPHKRLIDQMPKVTIDSDNNTSSNHSIKFDKSLLDDREFRKTFKKEKIEINCEPDVMSRSLIR